MPCQFYMGFRPPPHPRAVSPVEFVAPQYAKFNLPDFLSSELYVSPVKRVKILH